MILEELGNATKRKQMGINIGKEEVRLFLVAKCMILFQENSRQSIDMCSVLKSSHFIPTPQILTKVDHFPRNCFIKANWIYHNIIFC